VNIGLKITQYGSFAAEKIIPSSQKFFFAAVGGVICIQYVVLTPYSHIS
jgi:hypothetical protein